MLSYLSASMASRVSLREYECRSGKACAMLDVTQWCNQQWSTLRVRSRWGYSLENIGPCCSGQSSTRPLQM
eukprot:SAG31_NODE_474_length_15176_cov_7.362340_15_plen_71_part_00